MVDKFLFSTEHNITDNIIDSISNSPSINQSLISLETSNILNIVPNLRHIKNLTQKLITIFNKSDTKIAKKTNKDTQ